MHENEISGEIVDAAYKIHRRIGPGLFESVYERILRYELERRGLVVLTQHPVPVVYESVQIDEAFRGEGLGRETMLAAETWARAHGGTRIGLNVFGPNTVARHLYESLGYGIMGISMYKDLEPT